MKIPIDYLTEENLRVTLQDLDEDETQQFHPVGTAECRYYPREWQDLGLEFRTAAEKDEANPRQFPPALRNKWINHFRNYAKECFSHLEILPENIAGYRLLTGEERRSEVQLFGGEYNSEYVVVAKFYKKR